MERSPLVSVIMAAYNAGQTIGPVIKSTLGQTFSDFEFIIVDDASQDNTKEIINSFPDSRIRMIINRQNYNPAGARNIAIEASKGKYIAVCDADDLNMPTRLEMQVQYLESHPEVDVVGSNAYFFNNFGKIVGTWERPVGHPELVKKINRDIPLIHPTIMAKSSWLKAFKYDGLYSRAQDRELFFRTYRISRFANIREYLLAYRDPGRLNPKKLFWNNWYNIFMRWRHWRDYGLPASSLIVFPVIVAGRLFYYSITGLCGRGLMWKHSKTIEPTKYNVACQQWIYECLNN